MESATGKIDAIDAGVARVVVDSPVACPRCAAGKGCGAGLLAGDATPRHVVVDVPDGMMLTTGEDVTLSIAPRYLLRAAMLAYGLPLLSMLAFAGLAWVAGLAPNDGWSIGFAVAGLVAGIVAGRHLLRREAVCEQFTPVIDGRTGR